MAHSIIRVAVLMGGRSGEHDVSRSSGWAVLSQLPRDRFDPFPALIDRQGRWHFPSEAEADPARGDPPGEGLALPEALRALLDMRPEVAFIAMHGPEGEDGRMQSLLQLLGVPFTGSGAEASALAMCKPITKAVYRAACLPVAEDWILSRAMWAEDRAGALGELKRRFHPPWVLKTPRLGSSVGLSVVPAGETLESEVDGLMALDDHLLVEAHVAGRELTCGVLDAPPFGPTRALPVLEISPVGSPYFDYHAKYTPGAAQEICPAPIPDEIRDRVQAYGLTAHRALGCRGFSRTDFIWAAPDRIVTLETNTIPGLTRTSLLPQQAAAAGISFSELVSGLVLAALEPQA